MDLSKCTKEIVKIAENNTEVQYCLFTSTGEKVIIECESYGQNRIDDEKKVVQAELDKLTSYKTDAKTIDSLLDIQQKKMEDVLAIETEMKKINKGEL